MESILTDLAQKVAIPHTAVLIIDMQNAFCAEGYPTPDTDKKMIRNMIPRLQNCLTQARKKNVNIIFIKTVMDEDDFTPPIKDLCLRVYGREIAYCMRDSWEAEFIPELQPMDNEVVIEKTRYNAFYKTELEAKLKELGIVTLIVTGVGTNVCVETTCRDGFIRDYYIVVPNDLVATMSEELHKSSLYNLGRWFATVTSSEELLRLWDAEVQ